jgi:Holliday junction DNA helicase RuvA
MIGSLKGIVQAIGADRALVEVQGVGYLVHAGARTLSRLAVGAPAHVWVETQVRDDSLKLFGFLTDQDRAWFARLQDINGVGAKVALAILDALSPGELMQAAALGDNASLSRANGVGPKLAARILVELKGRAPPPALSTVPGGGGGAAFTPPDSAADTPDEVRREALGDIALRNQAISALVNLGIAQVEAMRAVAAAYAGFVEDPPVNVLVKAALKETAR